MITNLHVKHRYFHQKFLIAWIGFTIFCVSLLSFYQWQHVHSEASNQFERDANQFAFTFDKIIENILTSFDRLPLYAKKPSCDDLLPQLQSIVFNNFYISGIVIRDFNNNLVCETATSDMVLPAPLSKRPSLFGPLKINKTANDVFLLQTHIGQYHLGIYILKLFFDDLFKYTAFKFKTIALYDTNQKKIIFHTGNERLNPRLFLQRPITSNPILIRASGNNEIVVPLQNLDNIDLVITSPVNIVKPLAFNLLLMLLPLLFFFWLFYTYFRRMMKKRFSLKYAMESALKNEQFYPVYQPVRDESKDRFCGAEVLIRWRTDFDEVVMPDYFIDEAEKSGLIVPMTLQLIEKALQECQPLFQENPTFYLSFNLSPGHFKNEEFVNDFCNLCAAYNIRPQQLMLELTERELFNVEDVLVTAKMKALRTKGFSLALDDFGTGQANIHYLQHFPFNYLKVDKLFINTIGTGAITEALNQGIINMARSLGLCIIAEGVESKIQLDYLRKNEVNYIQGWLYARDMPYKQFAELLKHPTRDSK